MGIFDVFRLPDINEAVREFHRTEGAVLLDVRGSEEYRQGNIPGSVNVPLQRLEEVEYIVEDHAVPLFVYCHSGARSRQAVAVLRNMGYTDVKNIGGIAAYAGELRR